MQKIRSGGGDSTAQLLIPSGQPGEKPVSLQPTSPCGVVQPVAALVQRLQWDFQESFPQPEEASDTKRHARANASVMR
jgi:hypothetical protein